jgi:hypothetical protein
MDFVDERFSMDAAILCPCSHCLNHKSISKTEVQRHLLLNGISSTYTRWIHHGESNDGHVLEQPVNVDPHSNHMEHENNDWDHVDDILTDHHSTFVPFNEATTSDGNPSSNPDCVFETLMEEAKLELYPGYSEFSKFSWVVKMLHLKSYYRITNSSFTKQLQILSKSHTDNNCIPKSFEEAKKLLHTLRLGYVSIHVCPNNCVFFRGHMQILITVQNVKHRDGKILSIRKF